MTFKSILLISSMTTAIMLSACGNDDMAIAPVVQDDLVERIEDFTPSDLPGDSFEQALNYMDLAEQGQFSWDKKTISGDRVEFVNLVLPDEGGTINRLTLSGAHLENGNPHFQIIEVEGLTYLDVLGRPTTTIEKARLNVSDALKDDILENVGFLEVESLFDDLDYLGWGPLSSGGGYVEGVVLSARRAKFEIGFFGWAPEEEDSHIAFLIDDLKVEPQWRYQDTDALNLTLDHMSISGFDVLGLDDNSYADYNIYNVFDPGFESVIVENFDMSVDSFILKLPSYRGGLTGDPEGKTTHEADIPVMTIGFEDEPFAYQLMPLWELFNSTGLQKVELSHRYKIDLDNAADTADVDYFDLTIKDAFTLNMDFEVSGYRAFITDLIRYHDITSTFGGDFSEMMDRLAAQEEVMKASRAALDLGFFEAVVTDKNGLDKVFASMAETQGVSEDVARQQAKAYAMMMTLGVSDTYLSDLAEDFAVNAQSFLTESGQLKLSMRPEEDFNLGQALQSYADFEASSYEHLEWEADNSDEAGIKDLDAEKIPEHLGDIFGPMNVDFEHIKK